MRALFVFLGIFSINAQADIIDLKITDQSKICTMEPKDSLCQTSTRILNIQLNTKAESEIRDLYNNATSNYQENSVKNIQFQNQKLVTIRPGKNEVRFNCHIGWFFGPNQDYDALTTIASKDCSHFQIGYKIGAEKEFQVDDNSMAYETLFIEVVGRSTSVAK